MDEIGIQRRSPIYVEDKASTMDEPDDVIQETQSRQRLEFEKDDDDLTNVDVDVEKKDQMNTKISEERVPRIGMEFQTEDEAYEFYNAYALEFGFSVRRSKTHSYKGRVLDMIFVCACEGKRGPDKRADFRKSHRPETRFGCKAMLKICCRQTGRYRIVKFIPEHNHNLASPSKAHLFRSHRSISLPQALDVDMAEMAGIAPKNAFEFMAKQAGGRENLGFAHVDYKNYLRSKRTLQVRSGDTGGVLEYLQMMQINDPNFFYAIQVDEDDLITNIFWADAKMMADYEDFGDVVCFDTTYRKHKDGRPIALFVGVNHHKQTTIFGCALLYDETTSSFIWLFNTFSRAMGEKLPKTILTDQDAAMSSALASQWPESYHRLCVWHIFQNAAIHLSHVFTEFPEFLADFSSCIYDHDHEEDFLNAWSKMLQKYNLQTNKWLKRLFGIKEKWALVYGRDTFCADMISTQRSESMNKLIKSYVSYKHDMRRFFEHFQRLLYNRRYDEMVADFKANQSKVIPSFPVEIMKPLASVYTPKVFKLFEAELCKSYDCHIEICDELGASVKYLVKPSRKHYNFVVSYDAQEATVSCSCRKFEFGGILYCHILKMFSIREIEKVPDKYILKRWTLEANKGSTRGISESSAGIDPKVMMGRRYRDLFRLSTRMVTKAAEFGDVYTFAKEGLMDLMREVDLKLAERASNSSFGSFQVAGSDPSPNDMMQKVKGIKTKPKSGNRSSKRIRSSIEMAGKHKKAKKKPSPDNGVQRSADNHIAQVPFHAHPTNLAQFMETEPSTSAQHQDQFYLASLVDILNAPSQQSSLLPLLQHSQCDDIYAYAQLLQTSEMRDLHK